jgi:hypothetical protein
MTENNTANRQSVDFDPVFTHQQVRDAEAVYEENWGESRRIMMTVLARSSAQLLEGFGESPDVMLDVVDRINGFRDHMKASLEMADLAVTRLLAVAGAVIDEEGD